MTTIQIIAFSIFVVMTVAFIIWMTMLVIKR